VIVQPPIEINISGRRRHSRQSSAGERIWETPAGLANYEKFSAQNIFILFWAKIPPLRAKLT